MKKIIAILMFTIFTAMTAMAATSVDKMTIMIYPRTHRGQAEWRWTPKIDMNLNDMPESKPVTVEYTLPNGKPFVTVTCSPDAGWADVNKEITLCGNDLEAEQATTMTGQFGFTIKLAGATLYSGKFHVGRYVFNPANIPANAKNFYYFVDYDWRLTTAYVGYWKDEYMPWQLFTWVWLKGGDINTDKDKLKAYLFYKGKQIVESTAGGDLSAVPEENDAVHYNRMRFRFDATFSKPEQVGNTWWRFDQNPGDYEIRVNRYGAVVRSMKFTIGANGKIVIDDVGKEVKEGYAGLIVPVTISGTSDGKLTPAILNSGWWGNPITGITP